MKPNIGRYDRSIRLLLTIIIAMIGLYNKSWWALLAIVPLLTAVLSFCPLYALLGVNTCNTDSSRQR
jgi:hypothetical protein